MKKNNFLSILLLGFLSFLVVDCYAQYAPKKQQEQPNLQKVNQQFASQSLRFTENKGQVADLNGKLRPDILFTAQNDGVKLFLTANGIHYQFRRDFTKPMQAIVKPGRPELEEVDSSQFYRLDLSLKGANANPKVIKDGAGTDVENFYLAHCPDGINGVKNYNRITYKEVYPNIDWVVYVKDGMLEYDFVVRPGGNVDEIKLQYNGAENLDLDKLGALHIKTPLGSVSEQKPISFQQEGREIASRFVLEGNTLGFEVPGYNENKALTIDPSIVWATYYGGSSSDLGLSVSTDDLGNVYLAGETSSSTGIASGGHQNTSGGTYNAFVVKFNSGGIRLWATYYGGTSYNIGGYVATDGLGNVYLAGSTQSQTAIAYNGHQNTRGGSNDAYLVKFNESGIRLWGTYYGGSGSETGFSVATDGSNNVYLAGVTLSTYGIASGGHQNSFVGSGYNGDAFLVKFNAAGVRQWGTYYGGTGSDHGRSVATDGSGNVFLAGSTTSSDNIASGGFQNYRAGSDDAFLVKFNSAGVRQWGTFYGGSGAEDLGSSVVADASGNVYLASQTMSATEIAYNGHQNSWGGDYDAFLVKFRPNGQRLWATYYGDIGSDYRNSVAVDGSDNVYLAGYTSSTTGIASGGVQNTFGGSRDGFLVKFNKAGIRIWGTYYGGSDFDNVLSVGTDGSDNVYLAGNTKSTIGIASGGHQNTLAGSYDAFLVKISNGAPLPDTDGDGVPDADDCAPNDINKYKVTSLFIDADNDDYDAGKENVCYGENIPQGYKLTSYGTDCDDNNDAISGTPIWYKDSDNDGYSDGTDLSQCNMPIGYKSQDELIEVFGDCNDANAAINPAATEICDGLDNDCDGKIDQGVNLAWYKDEDNDGYSDGTFLNQCDQPVGYKLAINLTATTGDCSDANAAIHPGAPEICDGLDNDCNGVGDEGADVNWYKDADNDGYSDGTTLVQCFKPTDYKLASNLFATNGDCNDANADIHPAAPELCDGIDNDCNGQTDEGVIPTWYKDGDNDGYSDGLTLTQCNQPPGYKLAASLTAISGDCDDNKAAIHPGATELCDGIDNDCDGLIDGIIPTWYKDADNDGYSDGSTIVQCSKPDGYKLPANLIATSGDCDESKSSIHPGATELCDGLDNDCDTQVDEGCPVGTAWYFDYDKDSYGNPAKVVYAVSQPYKYVANPDDCKDWDATYHPGATELCDGKDNDCDGLIDEGCPGLKTWYRDGDHDGYGNPKYTKTTVGQPTGFVANADDCKDWDASVYPGHGCPPLTGITGTDANTTQPKAMVENSPEMVVFPNPATTELTVTLNGFEAGKKLELQLVQADGKVVLGQSLTPFMQRQQVRLDVRKLNAGFYLVQVRQGVLQQTKKVMIAR